MNNVKRYWNIASLTPNPRHRRRNEKEKRLFGVGWMNLLGNST